MIFNTKKKENIYLSPYTPMTNGLEKYLKDTYGISICGYIDASKDGDEIYQPTKIKKLSIDKIFILSPSWAKEIYINLSEHISSDKLVMIFKNNNLYRKSLLNYRLSRYIDNILIKLINNIFDYFNIKIVKLWTNRIGEFCLETEAFLEQIKYNKVYKAQNIIVLSYIDKQEIANNTLYNLYIDVLMKFDKLFLLKNNLLAKYLRYTLTNHYIKSKYCINIEQHSNAYELFMNKKQIIFFNKQDIIKGEKILKKLNIFGPFVCIFARDSQYLVNTFKNQDWSYHNYRDADINSYELAIKYLIKNGYTIVRIGSIVQNELLFKHAKCIDYPYNQFQSDFMDIFLISQCEFAIGGHSGILDICNVFSKTRLGVNHMPIDAPPYSTKDDIYIPKKLQLNGEYIGLKKYFEIINNSKLSHFKNETYEKLDLQIEDNNSSEILMIVKEYLNDFKECEADRKNLEMYYQIHSKSEWFSDVKTKISLLFLRENPWFIEA